MTTIRPLSLKRAKRLGRTPWTTFTRPINKERAALRYARQYGSKRAWITAQPCAICGRRPPSDCAHTKSRGAGGTSADMIPLCRREHLQQHAWGVKTFEERKRVDFAALAAEYEADWRAEVESR